MSDALALLELRGVASGYAILNIMLKHSPVTILEANLIEPGHFLILYTGAVAEVEEAHQRVLEERSQQILAQFLLPFAHDDILKGLKGADLRLSGDAYDCLGVVETKSISGALLSLDHILKNTHTRLVGLRVAGALGGKGYFILCGAQHDVEWALDLASDKSMELGGIVDKEVIATPHDDAIEWLLRPTPFRIQ